MKRLAHEFRQAADETLPASLDQMIYAWEGDRYAPSEPYQYLYGKVFPDEMRPRNGSAYPAPDPDEVLERARQVRADGLAALRDAAQRSGKPDLIALAGTLASLQQQVDAARAHLEQLLAEDGADGR